MMKKRQLIRLLALFSLLLAYGYGLCREQAEKEHLLNIAYPELTGLERLDEETFQYRDGHKLHYLVVEREQGWGGPMDLAIQIDQDGCVEQVKIMRHCETPSFLGRLYRDKHFAQYRDMVVDSPFVVHRDIDAVSGATISSRAVARAVQKGSHRTACTYLGLTVAEIAPQISFGSTEMCAAALFLSISLLSILKTQKFRRLSLLFGLLFLGYYASFPLSVTHLSSLLLGRVPPLESHLFSWIILFGSLGYVLFFGKNLYCSSLCPFGAMQEFLHEISGTKIKIHPKVMQWAKFLPVFFTWAALMVIFISRNPAQGNYEPFGAIFSFEGQGLIWLILPLIIFISFFIPRFWCRFFCPAGCLLNKGVSVRNQILMRRRGYEK